VQRLYIQLGQVELHLGEVGNDSRKTRPYIITIQDAPWRVSTLKTLEDETATRTAL